MREWLPMLQSTACAAALSLFGTAALAAPLLQTSTRASAGHSFGLGDDQLDADSGIAGIVESGSDAAWSGAAGAGVGSARAFATFGRLGVYAHGQWLGGDGIGNGGSVASFEDLWTVMAPGLEGTTGILHVTVRVTGTRVAGWPTTGVAVLQGYECLASGSGCRLDFSEGGGTGTFGFGVPFTYGEPFTYVLSMNGNTAADKFYPSGTIDFIDTAVISAVDVRDASGGAVAAFDLSAASGYDYLGASPPSSDVAAPDTAVLILAAFGIVVAHSARRRQPSR